MAGKANNITKISELINDIESEFDDQKMFIEQSISQMRNTIKLEKLEIESTKSKLNKKYNLLKETYNKLIDEKNYHLQVIQNDQNDIENIDSENYKLKQQIENQEIINLENKNILENKKSIVLELKKKIDVLNKINEKKEKKIFAKVEECKKYLGLDFKVIEDNKIKVMFDKICKDDMFECYVILDLNAGYSIVDVNPKVSGIERYALSIKEKTRFFDLVRDIRKEFIREFCK